MKQFLVLTAFCAAVYADSNSAAQVDRLRRGLAKTSGFLHASTAIEKQAALFPEGFKMKYRDAQSQRAIAQLQREIARLAPRWRFPDGPHDERLEAFARASVDKWHSGGRVRRTVMDPGDWKTILNEDGTPMSRSRRGYVLYKMPNESLCRQHTFVYSEVFDGTQYLPSNGVRLQFVRYLVCR